MTAKKIGVLNSKYNTTNRYTGNSNKSKPCGARGKKKKIQDGQYCFRCGSKEHLASNCTLGRDIECRSCGVKGHISKVCFKNGQPTLANFVKEIFVVKNPELRGKFKKALEVNGRQVIFDVDSGAAVTLNV